MYFGYRPALQKNYLVVPLLLQQAVVVARNLGGEFLFSLRQEVHPSLALLEETLLLEHRGLQFTGERGRI